MKKIFAYLITLFIVGMLCGCASPGSLRKDGAAFIFTAPKGTPQEFGRYLVSQLDERLWGFIHILRNNSDGNATILTMAGGQELRMMFDINKVGNGLNILVYFSWCNDETCRDCALCPLLTQALNACGAKESAALSENLRLDE